MLRNIQIRHNGTLHGLTNSPEHIFRTLKTLGVKGLDRKKDPKKWLSAGEFHYKGITGEVVVVVK